MRFIIQHPDLRKAPAETRKDIERAVMSGMRDAADGLKQDLRDDVVATGLGERLSRTWRGKTFPEAGESAEGAAYVWSRAPKIVDAFDRGVVIRSARGLFLAIPTAAARNRRKSGQASVIVFTLVPQVALRKWLDVETSGMRQAVRRPRSSRRTGRNPGQAPLFAMKVTPGRFSKCASQVRSPAPCRRAVASMTASAVASL